MLASLYEQMGLSGSASAVQRNEKKTEPSLHTGSFDPSAEEISILLNLFQGREFGYVRYRLDTDGTAAHFHAEGVLGSKEIRCHLRGEETLGVYPLRADRTLKFACIHVGIPWRRVIENTKNTGFLAFLEEKAHQYAREIIEKGRGYGIPGFLENPGERGGRIWFFFEEFIPLELAERFLNCLIDRVRAPFSDVKTTLLLGIKRKGIGHEEHPVMLPLGFNPRTGKRSLFTDKYGEPHEDQLLWAKKIRAISRREIQDLIRSVEKRRPGRKPQSAFDPLQRLRKNCPVLEEIIRKAQSGRMLSHEEKMVIFFTLGFLQDDFSALHGVLEPCPDYRPKKVERMASRLRSNPISCPKIREILPETTAYLPCNCSFRLPEGGYPTPLLHVDPALVPTRKIRGPSASVRQLTERYHELSQKILGLNREKEGLEAVLGNIKQRALNDEHRSVDDEQ